MGSGALWLLIMILFIVNKVCLPVKVRFFPLLTLIHPALFAARKGWGLKTGSLKVVLQVGLYLIHLMVEFEIKVGVLIDPIHNYSGPLLRSGSSGVGSIPSAVEYQVF